MHINNTEVNNTFNTPDENGTLPVFVGTLETNYLFGRTEKGCLCNSSWWFKGDQGDCAINAAEGTGSNAGAVPFKGCGMQLPCDGDNNDNDAIYPTWCFTQEGCGKAPSGADSATWDYCHPPKTTTTTTTTTSTTTTTDRFKTQRGCNCLEGWGTDCTQDVQNEDGTSGPWVDRDGAPGIRAQQFYRCGMTTPCDGDNNKLEKNPLLKATFSTWCFVNSSECPDAISSGLADNSNAYDYCTPLDEFYGSTTVTTLTTSTITTTTVTTVPRDELQEAFSFMGDLPYWSFFIIVGVAFIIIIIVICVCKRQCGDTQAPRYRPPAETFDSFEHANPAARANSMSNVGKQTQELPMVPGRSGGVSMAGAASNKMATLTPGSIAPGAASAFDSENATYALVHEPMEIHTVEAFMEPKTSGYEFIAPDAFALGTKYDNSFAHEGAAPSYETLFEGQHPAEVIEGLHDYEYREMELKSAAAVHDTTAEGSGRVSGSSSMFVDIHPGHGLEGNEAPAAHAYLDDSDDEDGGGDELFPTTGTAETEFGLPESTLPRNTGGSVVGRNASGDAALREPSASLADAPEIDGLSTELAAANPFGDPADVTDDYGAEIPLNPEHEAAPPIPQRPAEPPDVPEGVITDDGGLEL